MFTIKLGVSDQKSDFRGVPRQEKKIYFEKYINVNCTNWQKKVLLSQVETLGVWKLIAIYFISSSVLQEMTKIITN